ncbi:MAG: thioredoxin [Vampirovibrionales bacterium]
MMMAGNVVEITDAQFEEQVLQASTPVLVDFWAPWCGPCRALAPTIADVADELAGKVRVCKINTDENIQSAQKFGISSIPTVILFKDGKPVEQSVGNRPKADFVKMIEAHL